MSYYLEFPEFEDSIPFRAFLNDGMTIVYPHWHKEIEIIYSRKGKVNIGIDEDIVQLEEGEIFFFPSGEAHYFLASPDSERYVFQFNLKLFDEKILRTSEDSLLSLFESGERHSRNWPKTLARKATELLVHLYGIEQSKPAGMNYLTLGYLYQLIGEFYLHLPRRKERKAPTKRSAIQHKETLDLLNQVFEYVEDRYREVIALEDVAKFVGFSPYYFTRFFKTNTGQTFMQFLTEYRINQAKFILANEKIPMVEVAEKAGFASVKTFHHVFKEAVGQSPLQYRKNLNNH
ncbi:AraC family transcriptional regulator [Paenibacillus sp. FSL R5-0527]|uniref:AraC family transcriptional regulator n=1 Tax=Paenibacillus TaxID=44249 RepID=UPI00097A7338|nr:AraC family transcriptional regulator [Paenibacillus macerans]MED4954263.1 AraC family transcriptional regulator [Paenibacillus macerans]OMG51546.1 AraC family transcriptional regulator [Paenibacillus macerans]